VKHPFHERQFNSIWKNVWKEKGYELEQDQNFLDRLLIMNNQHVHIGTVEFKPYLISSEHYLNQLAPFAEQEEIAAAPHRVMEVDKVALLKEHRGPNLSRLLAAIVHYSEYYNYEYTVCLLEPVFFRALRVSFRIPVKQVGSRIPYKGDDVIPSLINCSQIYQNKTNFDWVHQQLPPFANSKSHVL